MNVRIFIRNILASGIAVAGATALAYVVFMPAAASADERTTVVPPFSQTGTQNPPMITESIDENMLVTLKGNTHPAMKPENDAGPVSDDLRLDHMYLQLKRSSGLQQKADDLIEGLHDSKAAQYHKWLTADQVTQQFGPSEQDVQTVTKWLEGHGFTVNVVYRANGVIDFSGRAGSIRDAFHTEIHNLVVNGKPHIANASDPQIPAALATVIEGVVSMHDFRPHPLSHSRLAAGPSPEFTFPLNGQPFYAVVPGDLHTIYNLNPLYAKGISGQGQTVVVVNESNVYATADWNTFRWTFGLAQQFPHGSFTEIHPQPSNNPNNGGPCADPGANPADSEATLDVEWASAAAPNAAIVNASCANTNTNAGFLIAMQNLITGPGPAPPIISISYAGSEAELGAAFNAYINQLYQLAVMQGVSVFVGAGDTGADVTDFPGVSPIKATAGISVSAFASTPHNVAVGGTDFADTYLHETGTYWSKSNGQYFDSALSYVPEIPWNGTCGSRLIANYLGFATTYGAGGLCNSAAGAPFLDIFDAGSGGPSNCASGTPSITWQEDDRTLNAVSGTCKGYHKPSYQRLVRGNPRDGVRDLPDVALFAALGVWSHAYSYCYSDPAFGGVPCTGSPSNWSHGGGTSFASPIMAAIQALVNQATGERQGNPNYVYYVLAALEDDFGEGARCSATLGNKVDPRCIFHDVRLGDNDVPCVPATDNTGTTIGTFNCYQPSGIYGVLSKSNTSYKPAFTAAPGWDFATGLGSVNAYNLVKWWPRVGLK
jgi:subtilase family serine protease